MGCAKLRAGESILRACAHGLSGKLLRPPVQRSRRQILLHGNWRVHRSAQQRVQLACEDFPLVRKADYLRLHISYPRFDLQQIHASDLAYSQQFPGSSFTFRQRGRGLAGRSQIAFDLHQPGVGHRHLVLQVSLNVFYICFGDTGFSFREVPFLEQGIPRRRPR